VCQNLKGNSGAKGLK